MSAMKNIQVIDGADNATFSLFQATDDEFAMIFPGLGQDIELIEDFVARVGDEAAGKIMGPIWARPILKRDAIGLHGTLFYEWAEKRQHLPATKREVDLDPMSVNWAQRELFAANR
jgi:hypothetical protein